jgi:hypothetical protein
MRAIVDENVAIVANDNSRRDRLAVQADEVCQLECIKALRSIVKNGITVIDDAGEILRKYREYLSGRGQPGVGDAFLKHIYDNQYNKRKVQRTPLAVNEDGTYSDFPSSPGLNTFDPSDRVFVALARASTKRAVILNALDSDYSEHAEPLQEAGIKVIELCPDCI